MTYQERYHGSTDIILSQIHKERLKQFEKWGFQDVPPSHFALILGEEVGEVNKEIIERHFTGLDPHDAAHLRKELIQTAAVCVQFIQWIDIQTKAVEKLALSAETPNL